MTGPLPATLLGPEGGGSPALSQSASGRRRRRRRQLRLLEALPVRWCICPGVSQSHCQPDGRGRFSILSDPQLPRQSIQQHMLTPSKPWILGWTNAVNAQSSNLNRTRGPSSQSTVSSAPPSIHTSSLQLHPFKHSARSEVLKADRRRLLIVLLLVNQPVIPLDCSFFTQASSQSLHLPLPWEQL